jgi:tRNA 2-thiouridine synthesizing protein B
MTTLYLINRRHVATELLSLLVAEDAVLLCGDAVQDWPQQWPTDTTTHILAEDAAARNLQLPAGLVTLDYSGFVELCTQHTKVVAW